MTTLSKINFDEELDRRRISRDMLQTQADVDEISRRMVAVQEGKAKMLTRKEADALSETAVNDKRISLLSNT
jgi:hypothetical protein